MSMGKELRQKFKERLYPFFESRGYKKDPHDPQVPTDVVFRKVERNKVFVICVQWDKYWGAKFAVNFGMRKVSQPVVVGQSTYEGRLISRGQLTLLGVLTSIIGLLQWLCSRPISLFIPTIFDRMTPWGVVKHEMGVYQEWFRQKRSWFECLMLKKKRTPDDMIGQVISGFTEIEDYFQQGVKGRRLRFPDDGFGV